MTKEDAEQELSFYKLEKTGLTESAQSRLDAIRAALKDVERELERGQFVGAHTMAHVAEKLTLATMVVARRNATIEMIETLERRMAK